MVLEHGRIVISRYDSSALSRGHLSEGEVHMQHVFYSTEQVHNMLFVVTSPTLCVALLSSLEA